MFVCACIMRLICDIYVYLLIFSAYLGIPVKVNVTMHILSISTVSEVQMVSLHALTIAKQKVF